MLLMMPGMAQMICRHVPVAVLRNTCPADLATATHTVTNMNPADFATATHAVTNTRTAASTTSTNAHVRRNFSIFIRENSRDLLTLKIYLTLHT